MGPSSNSSVNYHAAGTNNPEAQPAEKCIADPVNVWMMSKGERSKLLQTVPTRIAEKFVDTTFTAMKIQLTLTQ